MNENKFIKVIKIGGKVLIWWKFIKTEVWSLRNDDGTYSVEGIYIPFELNVTKRLFGKFVGVYHEYHNK